MLGLGWTEMLVIGVVALIVIGPKDLPVVMNRVGKIIGQIRRMGSEFQREINKSTGLDEVRNLRNSITGPLKKTSDEIRREFNAMTPTGPKPSGLIKPTDAKSESVVDEIKSAAGMAAPKTADEIAAESGFKPTTPAPVVAKTTAVKAATPKRVVARKAPVNAKAVPTAPVVKTDLDPIDVLPKPAKTAAVKKPVTKAKAVEVEAPIAEAKPTPRKRAPAKPKAPTESAKAGDA